MRLSQVYDPSHKFNGLINMVGSIFFIFLIDFFLNFFLQYWVNRELCFMIYLGLLSMRLSISRDLDHGFDGLTPVDSSYFLCYFLIIFFQFHLSPLV
jgi:hypothetical protein